MSVGEYSCNSQTSEGSESSLVAFLHGPFVIDLYTTKTSLEGLK